VAYGASGAKGSQGNYRMTYVLKNPRGHVEYASISSLLNPAGNRDMWLLGSKSRYGLTKSEWCSSLTAAKRLFSTNVLSPKYWGKNIWERVPNEG
jgi:hypothetical protein